MDSIISNIEVIPKRPISIGIKEIPSIRLTCPKVKRASPVCGLMPMQLNKRPTAMARIFFTTFFPAMPITVLMPRMASMKYSGGPNFKACFARNGDRNSRTIALLMPPNVELEIASPRASPLFPFCDIG